MICDSGATSHMTGDKRAITQLKPVEATNVVLADGRTIQQDPQERLPSTVRMGETSKSPTCSMSPVCETGSSRWGKHVTRSQTVSTCHRIDASSWQLEESYWWATETAAITASKLSRRKTLWQRHTISTGTSDSDT